MSPFRRPVALVAAALLAASATACTPDPEPTPTPTSFASEEEAFAAAEATYRAYIDAANNIDLSNPKTFEPLYKQTTGDANAGAREQFSEMHAQGLSVRGATLVALLERHSVDLAANQVELDICLDVSNVQVTNNKGESVVAPDRVDIQAMRVVLISKDYSQFKISNISGRSGDPKC